MVDPSRKHGPFDVRYPTPERLVTPVWELRPAQLREGKIDSAVFLERFFPNRGRHDFEALAAYEGYRNALDRASEAERSAPWQSSLDGDGGAIRDDVRTRRPDRIAARQAQGHAPSSSLVDWESEGGNVERD
jgi:hypothetical protein